MSDSPLIVSSTNNKASGVVKFYSVQKCYGFIKRDDTKEYVFVHSKSITGKNQRRVTRSLAKGEHVEFDVIMSDRSPEAINVTGLNNAPVIGSEYALITMQWHQYNDYKQELIRYGEQGPRELSPRARRYFHRKQPRDYGNDGRYDQRNDRNRPRPRRKQTKSKANASDNEAAESSKATYHAKDDDINDDASGGGNKSRRRRFNHNRKWKKDGKSLNKTEQRDNDSQTNDTNITALLSELTINNKTINTANSTSSESLDFEKINNDDSNISGTGNLTPSTASSRLAATFNKGNQ